MNLPSSSLGQAVRASAQRGLRFGAVLGASIGAVMVLGAFIGGIWSAWRPGFRLQAPSVAVLANLVGYLVGGVLIMAGYGAGIGAVLMGIVAALRHRR